MTRQLPVPEQAPEWAAELTPRERRFVEEYVVDLNGKAAAIRAGLGKTPKSATEIASRMRKKAPIAAAISELINERAGTTSVVVLNEIARIAFAKFTDYGRIENGALVITDTDKLTEDQLAAIAEITETTTESSRTIKIRLHDKSSALDKLAKVLGLYRERVEVSGPNGGPIEIDDAKARLAQMIGLDPAKVVARSVEMARPVEVLPPLAKQIPTPALPPTISGN